MHELSLCGAIYDIADRAAGGREVSVIHLQVGRLRQVIPDTLTYCWEMVSEDTALAGSRLDVDYRPVTLTCRDCAEVTTLSTDLLLLCGACGAGDVTVTSGEELLVTSLDLVEV
jgi:hydrogenase nickel incorporation protein HypA/HybF